MFARGVFLLETVWEALVLGLFSQSLSWTAYFSFYSSFHSPPNVHVQVQLSRTDTCPISPYPEWLGVVVKLKSIVLSNAEYLMAVMAVFLLSFVAILSRAPLSIDADLFSSSQNCSYVVLVISFRNALGMPRTESSSAMYQSYLDFHCVSSAIPLLGSGLGSQCKSGTGPQIIEPHSYQFKC